VRIGHAGRKAEIAGAFDPASRVIRIRKFDSGIDALALARAMSPSVLAGLSAVSTSGDGQVSGPVSGQAYRRYTTVFSEQEEEAAFDAETPTEILAFGLPHLETAAHYAIAAE